MIEKGCKVLNELTIFYSGAFTNACDRLNEISSQTYFDSLPKVLVTEQVRQVRQNQILHHNLLGLHEPNM